MKAQELCESRGGRPGGLCGYKVTLNLTPSVSEFRSCVKVEVAVLGSPSLIVLVDHKFGRSERQATFEEEEEEDKEEEEAEEEEEEEEAPSHICERF